MNPVTCCPALTAENAEIAEVIQEAPSFTFISASSAISAVNRSPQFRRRVLAMDGIRGNERVRRDPASTGRSEISMGSGLCRQWSAVAEVPKLRAIFSNTDPSL